MSIPNDDPSRNIKVARPDTDAALPHLGIAGDTYTVLLSGADTNGRYCLIDMHIPPGGGPPAHRHDFEETFTILTGQIDVTFRGVTTTLRAGETGHIPADAPHRFANTTGEPARLLCTCAPAGQETFFAEIGVPLATRTEPPPKPDAATMEAFKRKSEALAPRFKTELLPPG